MSHRYAVIGSGMQGTAAAYDLALFGDAEEIRLLDRDLARASAAAERVNALSGKGVVRAGVVDAADPTSLHAALEGVTACLSASSYALNLGIACAAIARGAHFNDLGGNTDVVREQLQLDAVARAARVSVVPDCGVAPGMANTLAVNGIEALDVARHVHVRCGGLPADRSLPLGYKKLFALEGLTNEYFGKALVLREGRVVEIDTFEEIETLTLPPPIGEVEAFTTSGGTSTCSYTFEGTLETYDYKTIRYPGHYAAMKLFKTLGFLSLEPIEVKGARVVPRDVFHAVMDPVWTRPDEPDLLVLIVDVLGTKNGAFMRHRTQIIDRMDPRTGFTAMERTTAFAAAIVTGLQARGMTPAGAVPLERAVRASDFLKALAHRDIPLETSLSPA